MLLNLCTLLKKFVQLSSELPNVNLLVPMNMQPTASISILNETSFQISIEDTHCIDEQNHKGFFIKGKRYYLKSTIVDSEVFGEFFTGYRSFVWHANQGARTFDVWVYCQTHEGFSPGRNVIIDTPPSSMYIQILTAKYLDFRPLFYSLNAAFGT